MKQPQFLKLAQLIPVKWKARALRHLVNLYPPYLGTGIRVTRIDDDFRHLEVEMKLHWFNVNYVGTHFGGNLYAMTDPFFMLMLLENLGPEYLVWDKASHVEFIAPGKGVVTAVFEISEKEIEEIKDKAANADRQYPVFTVIVRDKAQRPVTKVTKTLYVKRK